MSSSNQNRKQRNYSNPTPTHSDGRLTCGGRNRITYNDRFLEETEEKLKRQPSYCSVAPGKKGKGASIDEIAALADQMEAICQQMQLLIEATVKALESIHITVQEMDNGLAASYIVDNGTSCILKQKKETAPEKK